MHFRQPSKLHAFVSQFKVRSSINHTHSTPSVLQLALRPHRAKAQLFTVPCTFFTLVQSSEATRAHCFLNMIKAGSCKTEAGMREDTPSTSATSLAPIARSALAVAAAAGEHSTEGSKTASGVNADLGVDSAQRHHMRSTLNKKSAREWAELKP